MKGGDKKVTSNFGSIGSFYDHKGYGVHDLLGEGKNREAKIKYM